MLSAFPDFRSTVDGLQTVKFSGRRAGEADTAQTAEPGWRAAPCAPRRKPGPSAEKRRVSVGILGSGFRRGAHLNRSAPQLEAASMARKTVQNQLDETEKGRRRPKSQPV